MTVTVTINKGTWIQARWFKANKPTSLAGMQMKVGCTQIEIAGIVRHIRGDETKYYFFIDPDVEVQGIPTVKLEGCTCGREHVQVDPKNVYWAENP